MLALIYAGAGIVVGFAGFKLLRNREADNLETEDRIVRERRDRKFKMEMERIDWKHAEWMSDQMEKENEIKAEIEEKREQLRELKKQGK